MACYIMKARTLNDDWFTFDIYDLPTLYSPNEFALLGKPNTPRLLLKSIRRGDRDTNLFEGDIISMENDLWVICYERGFYAINTNYVVRYLNTLCNFKVVGDCTCMQSPVPINFREKHLFKYKDIIFRLNDIIGAYKGKLLLRSVSNPVDVDDVNQECCLAYNGSRIFLGDTINNERVILKYGRVGTVKDNKFIDIATGGVIDDCIS